MVTRSEVGGETNLKKQFDWGRVAELLIPLMIVWALYTTFQGAVEFQNQGRDRTFVDYAGAMIGAMMILTPLALTSWFLGADLAARMTQQHGAKPAPFRRTVLLFAIFAVVFSASVFFTFNFYSQKRFGSDTNRLLSQELPEQMRNKILSPLISELNASYEDQKPGITALAGVVEYETFGRALLNVIQNNGSQNIQKVVSDRDKARSDLEASIASRTAELSRLKDLYKDTYKEIEDRTHDLALQNAAIGNEKLGIGGRKAGQGPKWDAATKAAKEDRQRIADLTGLLKEKGIDSLEASIKSDQDKLDKLGPSTGAAANKDGLDRFTVLLDRFHADPRWALVTDAAPLCRQIADDVRRLGDKAAQLPKTTVCEPTDGAARAALTKQQARRDALDQYERACGEKGQGDATLDGKLSALKMQIAGASGTANLNAVAGAVLEQTRRAIDDCVRDAAPLGLAASSQQKYLSDSKTFYEDNTRDKDRFQVAASDLRNGRFDAWLSLMYAIAQDAFILILKMLADVFGAEAPRAGARGADKPVYDQDSDTADLRARKALVREASPGKRGNRSDLDLANPALQKLPDDVRSALTRLLNRLARENVARPLGKGAFEVDNAAIDRIEEELPDAETFAGQRSAAKTQPFPEPKTGSGPQRAEGGGATYWDKYFH